MCMQRYTQRLSMNSESVHVSVCRVGTAAALGGGSDNALPQGKDSGVCVCVCVHWCSCTCLKCVTQYCAHVRVCVCVSVRVCVCMGVLTPISLTQDSLNSTRGGLQQHKLQGWDKSVCVCVCEMGG